MKPQAHSYLWKPLPFMHSLKVTHVFRNIQDLPQSSVVAPRGGSRPCWAAVVQVCCSQTVGCPAGCFTSPCLNFSRPTGPAWLLSHRRCDLLTTLLLGLASARQE